MANAVYPKWKEALLGAAANSALTGSGTTGLYALLVDTGVYTYNATHQFYTSLAGAIIGTEKEVTGVTLVNGIVKGASPTFLAVSGPTAEALVLYRKNTGASSTWQLCCYLDSGVTGLPVTPNGGDITVNWNATGIFGL
jgi:hypothetical protein